MQKNNVWSSGDKSSNIMKKKMGWGSSKSPSSPAVNIKSSVSIGWGNQSLSQKFTVLNNSDASNE